jgi:hypothetical protein
MKPAGSLALRAMQHCFSYLLLLVPIVLLADALDGAGLRLEDIAALISLLAPLCAAAAVAVVVATSRVRGTWDLCSLLGYSTTSLLLPILALSLLGASVDFTSTWFPSTAPSNGALAGLWVAPAPIAPEAALWPDGELWSRPDLSPWKRVPATLSTTELLRRIGRPAPRGARSGVDLGELLRRLSWALAWPGGALLGAWRGLSRTTVRCRSQGSPVLRAAVETIGLLVVWLLAAMVAAAYLSSTM